SPRAAGRGEPGALRKVHLGDVGELEVLIVAGALLAPEEVDLVAEATVVEVDGELLTRLHLELGLENRSDLAAGAVVDRHRGPDHALDGVLVGRDRRPVVLAEVADVAADVATEWDQIGELRRVDVEEEGVLGG